MQQRILKRHQAFGGPTVDDELLRHLVGTLFETPKSTYVAVTMNTLVMFVSWRMAGTTSLLYCFLLSMAFDALRVVLTVYYLRVDHSADTRWDTLWYDRIYLVLGDSLFLVVGISSYLHIAAPVDGGGQLFALSLTIAYAFASSARHSCRLLTFFSQVMLLCGPVVFAYMTLPIEHGQLFALVLVALIVYTSMMAIAANGNLIKLHFADQETRRLARYDMLTGLRNRYSFSKALDDLLAKSSTDPAHRFALILIDLDRFKEVNDTLGHSAGDAVIVEMASRLRLLARPDDIVARLGGDEFVVIAKIGEDDGDNFGSWIADRIAEELSKEHIVEKSHISVGASLGIAYFPEHGVSSEVLLKNVDLALYEAKRRGRRTVQVFDALLQSQINDARALEVEINRAVDSSEFEPWFQPIVDMATGEPIGYEALARWRHAQRGFIPPDRFIPIAESCGAIIAIGDMILEKSCRAAVHWPSHLTIAINLSPVQFWRPDVLVDSIKAIITRTGLDPARLHIEVTESLLVEDTLKTQAAIKELAALGVKFSLDDFGTGYSSLSYIQNYPFSKIKIDKKFIDHIETDKKSRAIVSAIRLLASQIDLEVVAEGVETIAQHAALRQLGVTSAQGYLYGKPSTRLMPARPRLAASASA